MTVAIHFVPLAAAQGPIRSQSHDFLIGLGKEMSRGFRPGDDGESLAMPRARADSPDKLAYPNLRHFSFLPNSLFMLSGSVCNQRQSLVLKSFSNIFVALLGRCRCHPSLVTF